ncbi:MAG: hypothetical protein ACKESB_01080 [Candidatus Hodgkinia cicadicola]
MSQRPLSALPSSLRRLAPLALAGGGATRWGCKAVRLVPECTSVGFGIEVLAAEALYSVPQVVSFGIAARRRALDLLKPGLIASTKLKTAQCALVSKASVKSERALLAAAAVKLLGLSLCLELAGVPSWA